MPKEFLAIAADWGIAIAVLIAWAVSAEYRAQKERKTSDARADKLAELMTKQVESNSKVTNAISTLAIRLGVKD